MLRYALPLLIMLAACSTDPSDDPKAGNGMAPSDRESAATSGSAEVPLSDQPAPEPIVGGVPLEGGDFDPDIMRVTLAGDELVIEDAKHNWPLRLDDSSYDFTRNGLASFGTPSLHQGPADCPAGELMFLNYANGLSLAFQNGKLAGYWVKEGSRGIATKSGIRPGSPRSALGRRKIEEASFGKLVDIDGTFAILDDRATRVTDLYAGAACIYD